MSRRRGEFEHRTSIFEGAFRAWSHLGGLDPEDIESRSVAELDPLDYPLTNDPRLTGKEIGETNADGSARKIYPYEPLPRSGLGHPYVQAILSPWLGPDADSEAIQLGLTTLRTWWQHRRKGESGSAIAALGTEKMKGVVEGYTRHFFTLAHCIVVNEKVQPPRGLHTKMKELEKQRNKQKKKIRPKEFNLDAVHADLSNPNLTPLEKLHIAQRRTQESTGNLVGASPILNLKGKCAPGKIDLPGVVDAISRHTEFNATQFVHRGVPGEVTSGSTIPMYHHQQSDYGDPSTTPVVFASSNGDIQIAMTVEGITCAHCVKIVETVLRGCNGNKSPIAGLLDAAADRDISSVLIKIDKASNAKRIAFEAARNLSLVGYTAEAKSMSIVGEGSKGRADLNALATAFEVVANTEPQDFFDWTVPCTCPDNGVLRGDCKRHSQMNTRIFEAFKAREEQVTEYMVGCAMRYGMDCTCGPSCRCKNCPIHNLRGLETPAEEPMDTTYCDMPPPAPMYDTMEATLSPNADFDEAPIQIDQPMDLSSLLTPAINQPAPTTVFQGIDAPQLHQQQQTYRTRNLSILSIGNPGHRGSIGRRSGRNSEATFGRAMSGLSALSIDWENLEDFDLDEDHSSHIQQQQHQQQQQRNSIRRAVTNGDSSRL